MRFIKLQNFLVNLNLEITKPFNLHFNLAIGTQMLNWHFWKSCFKQRGGEISNMAVGFFSSGGARKN